MKLVKEKNNEAIFYADRKDCIRFCNILHYLSTEKGWHIVYKVTTEDTLRLYKNGFASFEIDWILDTCKEYESGIRWELYDDLQAYVPCLKEQGQFKKLMEDWKEAKKNIKNNKEFIFD